MIDSLVACEPCFAPKRPRWLIASWILLAICHAMVVWSARAVGVIPLWLLVVASIFLGVAGPHLVDRLDHGDADPNLGAALITGAERDSLVRMMGGFVIAVLLFLAVATYFLFFGTPAQAARVPRTALVIQPVVNGFVSHDLLESEISLRGAIDTLDP